MKLTNKFGPKLDLDTQVARRFDEINLPPLNFLTLKDRKAFAQKFYIERKCLVVTRLNDHVMDCRFI